MAEVAHRIILTSTSQKKIYDLSKSNVLRPNTLEGRTFLVVVFRTVVFSAQAKTEAKCSGLRVSCRVVFLSASKNRSFSFKIEGVSPSGIFPYRQKQKRLAQNWGCLDFSQWEDYASDICILYVSLNAISRDTSM